LCALLRGQLVVGDVDGTQAIPELHRVVGHCGASLTGHNRAFRAFPVKF
jgi:hypothetical protein